jgi:tetratricopeptide (TPR) repeat protein
LELYEKLADRASAAGSLNAIGVDHRVLGECRAALVHHHRALAIFRELQNRVGEANTLARIGWAHHMLADYAGALRSFHEGLEVFEALEEKRGIAALRYALGCVHESLGRYPEALDHFGIALDLEGSMHNDFRLGVILNGMGNVHNYCGRHDRAVACHERALERFEAVGDERSAAGSHANIGFAHLEAGRYEKALDHFRRALALFAERGHTRGIAPTHFNIGAVLERMGRHAEALESYGRAQEALDEFPDPITQVRVWMGLAEIHLHRGEPERAAALAREAVEEITRFSGGLSDEEGASAREVFSEAYGYGVLGAARSGDTEALAWFLEQGRAGTLREGLGAQRALMEALVPAETQRRLRVAQAAARRARQEYGAALRSGVRKKIQESRLALEAAQDDVRESVAEIQRTAKAASAVLFPNPEDLPTIRSRLGEGEALLYLGLTDAEAIGLVVERTGARMVLLAPSREIRAAVEKLLPRAHPYVDHEAVPKLRDLIVTPLELGDGVRRVLVSPMGVLGFVPFTLLLPDREVAYVPSGTTLGLLLEGRRDRGDGVLGLGDPDYASPRDARATLVYGREALAALPASRAEVRSIADVLLLGKAATEAGFTAAIAGRERWRAVHLACHGLLDSERPAMSSLAVAPDPANDGFLTCLEVLRTRIPADLVALSACDTARGKVYRAEGILGLPRAFLLAGAPRVLCSLWKVDDEATKALMVRFYELWNPPSGSDRAPLPAATALLRAQEHVRSHEKWAHPFFWAAWVLWGLPD